MKNTLETRLGVFFGLAIVVGFVVMEMVGTFDFMKPGLRLRARFTSVQELCPGDPVKVGGKQVGRVETIRLVDLEESDRVEKPAKLVEVVLKLTDARSVRTDSSASIRFSGLLGQNYVALSFGTLAAEPVKDGTLLTSYEQPDLGTLMTKLDGVATGVANLTTNLTGESLQNLIGPLVDFVRENNPRLTAIASNFQAVSGQIASGQGSMGKMVYDPVLYDTALSAVSNLNGTATDIRATIGEARTLLTDVRDGSGTLGKLANDPALYDETTAAMTTLKEIFQKINKGEGTMGKIVNDDTFYKNAQLSLQKLDKATESLEDQGPLSVMGIIVGNLF